MQFTRPKLANYGHVPIRFKNLSIMHRQLANYEQSMYLFTKPCNYEWTKQLEDSFVGPTI